jgi:RNA polymerase sigma factor (sigma-70 family)
MTSSVRDAAMANSAIRLAAAGDTVEFARIVATHHADMVRVAYVVSGGSQDLADDAVQAAWAIAWRKLGSLRDPDRLRPWLVSVAANEARQLCRRRRRLAVVEIDMGVRDPGGDDPADRAEELDLERVISHLSADDRALLALRYEAGLDSSEIGRRFHECERMAHRQRSLRGLHVLLPRLWSVDAIPGRGDHLPGLAPDAVGRVDQDRLRYQMSPPR